MAKRSTGEKRAEFIAQARRAVKLGLTQSRFLTQARAEGYSFRRTDMIAEWHNVSGTEKKSGLLRYVRKGYMPSQKVIAEVSWRLKREYMYKVRVQSRVRPGEPITDRFINIMQDRPVTPGVIEAMAWEMMQFQSPKEVAQIVKMVPWTAIRKVE